MKTYRLGSFVFLVIVAFLVVSIAERVRFSAGAKSSHSPIRDSSIKASLPAFLEKGKTYNFQFAMSLGAYDSHVTNPITP